MLSLRYPKEQRGPTFSEKTDTQLAHSGYFIQLQGWLGQGKVPIIKVILPCCPWEQTTHISVHFDYGLRTPGQPGLSLVQGWCRCEHSHTTESRLSRETTLQGLHSLKTMSQPLLINPNIATALLKHFSQSRTQGFPSLSLQRCGVLLDFVVWWETGVGNSHSDEQSVVSQVPLIFVSWLSDHFLNLFNSSDCWLHLKFLLAEERK